MEFLNTGFFNTLMSVFLLCIVLWIGYRVGRLALLAGGFGPAVFARFEERLFSLGAGLLIMSFFLFLGGVSKSLALSSIALFFVILLSITFVYLKRYGVEDWREGEVLNFFKQNLFFSIPVCAALFLTLARAAAPPGAGALGYGLRCARIFAETQSLGPIGLSKESMWPGFMQTFYVVGFLLQGTVLPRFFGWSFFALTAALIYSFGKRFYDERTARLSTLVFMFTPAALGQSGQAGTDLALTFFIFASMYAFLLYDIHSDERIFLISGAFAGAAAAAGHAGLGAFLALGALVGIRTKAKPKPAFYFFLSGFFACGFWYFRSWVVMGNPVYPYLSMFFGGQGQEYYFSREAAASFDLRSIWHSLTGQGIFAARRSGLPVTALYLFLPLLLFTARRARRPAVYCSVFTIVYGLFLLILKAPDRCYVSILPFLSVASGAAISFLISKGKRLKIAGMSAAVIATLFYGGLLAYSTKDIWGVVTGGSGARDYLGRLEPSFGSWEFLTQHRRAGEKCFNAASMSDFYGPGAGYVVNDSWALRVEVAKNKLTLPEFFDREKFSWILVSEATGGDVRRYVESHPYKKLHSYAFRDGGGVNQYQVWRSQ